MVVRGRQQTRVWTAVAQLMSEGGWSLMAPPFGSLTEVMGSGRERKEPERDRGVHTSLPTGSYAPS